MNRVNNYTSDNISSLIAGLDREAEAGIDPDFDGDPGELERQLAGLRLTFDLN